MQKTSFNVLNSSYDNRGRGENSQDGFNSIMTNKRNIVNIP